MRTLLVTLTTCLLALPANAKYSGGTGEPNDPYQIATAADLIALGEDAHDYDKHFILTADIDLDPRLAGGRVFHRAVIAPDTDPNDPHSEFQGTPFTGTFDGSGHTISHLTITGGSYLGLFGQLDSPASVSNLGLEAVEVSGARYVGGLAGYNNYGSITTSYSSGSASGGEYYVGGLVGYNDGSISFIGGLVGYNGGSITTSYSSGSASGGEYYVGGLVGYNDGSITTSYSTGTVDGNEYVGGLVGKNGYYGTVTGSFWDMQASGQTMSAGGTGKTTAEMQDIRTYQDAGWDFWGESKDGFHEIWHMPQGGGYPVLAVFHGYAVPQLSGRGTPEDPYLISNAQELGATCYYDPEAHYRLVASIDLSGVRWGTAVIPSFAGVFDGSGHTISHVTVNGVGYLGLFGRLGGIATNLGVVDVDVVGSGQYVGGLVGENCGTIAHCYTSGEVSGKACVGGLVGMNSYYSSIVSSYSSSAVNGSSFVGGLVGLDSQGSITMSYSSGSVSGTGVGGLVGGAQGGGMFITARSPFTGCFWDTETSGQATSAGGTGKTTAEMQDIRTYLDAGWDFVNETANGTCDYWQMSPGGYPLLRQHAGTSPLMPEGLGTAEQPYLIRDARDLGRVWFEPLAHYRLVQSIDLLGTTWSMAVIPSFAGVFDGSGYTIRNLHIQGSSHLGLFGQSGSEAEILWLALEAVDVNGTGHCVGSLVGRNTARIRGSYSTGTVKGSAAVGGLVGWNTGGLIATSHSTGTVSGNIYNSGDIGGLVGKNDGDVIRCYSTGVVSCDVAVHDFPSMQ